MDTLAEYAIILLIGWASGISLYLTIALLGIGGNMGWLTLPKRAMVKYRLIPDAQPIGRIITSLSKALN